MHRNKLLALFAALALLISAIGIAPPAYADDGQPPPAMPAPDPPPPEEVVAEVTTTTLQGPRDPAQLGKPAEIAPDAVLPGPGGQSGVLTSRLSYYYSWPSWYQQGSATIDLTGSPTAKAWTTLKDNGQTVESTGGSPCWTTTSCTSSTGYWSIASGHTGSNTAETVVFWSDDSSSYADATASHTF